ncbi:hypothetical protein FACS1894219_09920 [Clostridia bacterium]|nr:hypothetical protein FACS1894219_09920 [Clostridia bacterium]
MDSWSVSGTATYLDSSGSKTTAKGTYRLTATVSATNSSGTIENTSTNLVKTFS